MTGSFTSGVYTVDSYGRFQFLAELERAKAEVFKLVGDTLRDARDIDEAGRQIANYSIAKTVAAERLDEMAEEQKNAPEGTGRD